MGHWALSKKCWPGGAHNSFVLQNSSLGMRLAPGAGGDEWLIGK